MIAVSNGWVDAHKQTLLPEMFVEITYAATDPTLEESAVITTNSETWFSDPSNLVSSVDKRITKYGTLEHGLWGLDGTFGYLDGSTGDPEHVSGVISGADGTFSSTIPTITISFPTVRAESIPGFTITWSNVFNEWAVDFRVTAYSEDVQIAQKTITGNDSPQSVLWLTIENYTRITIEILKWNLPYHRARCTEVFIGVQTVYYKEDLLLKLYMVI